MLLTLIKNELIKLMKKSKTWIVFALFVLFVGISVFGVYKSDQNMRAWQSPESRLQGAQQDLKYINEEFKKAEEDSKSKKESVNPEYIEYLESRKVDLEERIKTYEDIIKNGENEEAWKLELDERIESSKEYIENLKQYNDEWSKKYLLEEQEQLDMFLYLKDNNIQPLYGWEYEVFGFMKTLMQFLGMAILVSGIAVFMSDIVSGECTPATLKFLLVQPVTRGKVLLSKFIAVVITVLIMIIGTELVGALFVKLTSSIDSASYPVTIGSLFEKVVGDDGVVSLAKIAGSGYIGTNSELFVKAILFQGLFIITTCAVIFLISTLIKSSMITMAASVVITVFLTIGCQSISVLAKMAHVIFINYADAFGVLTGGSAMMFANTNMTTNYGVIVMVVTMVVSYGIAHLNFTRKDILI